LKYPQDFRGISALFPPNIRGTDISNIRKISAIYPQDIRAADISNIHR
jgi:hypothetical protein